MQAKAQLQQTISRLTEECWGKCMGTPGKSPVATPACRRCCCWLGTCWAWLLLLLLPLPLLLLLPPLPLLLLLPPLPLLLLPLPLV